MTVQEILNTTDINIILNEPQHKPEWLKLTQDDVWGESNANDSDGKIIARGGEICPIFRDEVLYKSVTTLCNITEEADVIYWLEYVHGSNCVEKRKVLKNDMVAIRSLYMCW